MTVSPASFRADFPEFSSVTTYPDTSIQFWIGVAALRLDPQVWAEMLDFGTELFVAHNVILSARAAAAAAGPGAAAATGQATGPLASKSAGGLSASYDTAAAAVKDAGPFNLTTYGQQFAQLMAAFGAGGIQL